MKAATINDYAAPIKITEIDRPGSRDDAVLIAVHGASLNPIDDDILRSGAMKDMMPLSFPHVMGYDVSGEVIEIGKAVTAFKIGDAVFARQNQNDAGAIAEVARVKVKESDLALKPANLSHAEHGVRFEFLFMEPDGAMLAELGSLIQAGVVETVLGETYPMARTAEAYGALSTDHSPGKIVVNVA